MPNLGVELTTLYRHHPVETTAVTTLVAMETALLLRQSVVESIGQGMKAFWSWLLSLFVVRVLFNDKFYGTRPIQDWMNLHGHLFKMRVIQVFSRDVFYLDSNGTAHKTDTKRIVPSILSRRLRRVAGNQQGHYGFHLAIAPGCYFFWFRGHLFRFRMIENRTTYGGGVHTETIYEVLALSRNPRVIHDFLAEVADADVNNEVFKTSLYERKNEGWNYVKEERMPGLDSVVLDHQIVSAVRQEITAFLDGSKWSQSIGVPHRRAYLLEGLPGTGKTTLIKALAGEFCMHLYLLDLSADDITDTILVQALRNIKRHSIIVVEEVDTVFERERMLRSVGKNGVSPSLGVSMSGFLQATDGLYAPEECILVYTTNYPERLDPRFLREGRIDRRIHFTYATADQGKRLFQRYFPTSDERLAEDFGETVAQSRVVMSRVQEYLKRHKDSANHAWADRHTLATLNEPTAAENEDTVTA